MYKILVPFSLLLLLSACDSSQDLSAPLQADGASVDSSVAFAIPNRIRTSQAVNLDATRATVDTSAGPVVLTRNGDQFEGSIRVQSGSSFSYTLTIFEAVGGQNIEYVTASGRINEQVDRDWTITIPTTSFTYSDDDSDGATNLEEREAGSDFANSFSTPANPDGMPPAETAPGRLQFAASTYSVAEADGGLTISVGRAGGSDGRVSVRYELKSETAVLGRDFDASSGELIWEDGDATPKDIPVVVRTDDANDGEQTFTAHLFGPTGGVAIGNGFARITLADSTPPAQRGTIQMLSNSVTVDENTGQVEIQIERVNGSDGLVNVDYSTTVGTASASDFAAITPPRTIGWADGEDGPRTISIPITNDAEVEQAETFTVSLSNNLGGASLGLATTSVIITDTTPVPVPGRLALAAPVYLVVEGASVNLIVERLDGSDGTATVEFIVASGTADDNDYAATSGTLSWGSGDSSPKSITLTAISDTVLEADETVTVVLQNATGSALGASSATVTIADATVARPGVLAVAVSAVSVDEGGSVDVNVTRTGGNNGAVSVGVSAPASAEYTVSPASLTWADGDSTDKTVTISATADDASADTQTVNIQLAGATGGATVGSSTVAVTINDTSSPPIPTPGVVAFATSTASVNEGESVNISVTRNGGTDGSVGVGLSAPASAEYSVSPANLNWADGDSSDKTVTISAITNATTADTQTINVQLAGATGGATVGSGTVMVTINDTTVPTGPVYSPVAEDGQWEICIPPFNTNGPTAFATQLSANEGRIVSCIKTCDVGTIVLDDQFAGWGWNPTNLHSCTTARDAQGTYTSVPIYTPTRERMNLVLSADVFSRGNSIWSCVRETRQNAEFNYVTDQTNTIWYQFLDDGTYFYGSTQDGSQPADLLGPDTWSVNGRILELGHIDTGYRNTLFFPGNQTLHIHPTTDDRLSCTRQPRVTAPVVAVPVVQPIVQPVVSQ